MGSGCFKSSANNPYSSVEEQVVERRMSRESQRRSVSRRASQGSRDGSQQNTPRGTYKSRRKSELPGQPSENTMPHLKFATTSMGGKDDWYNQDSYIMLPNINGNRQMHLFGVFDGHGELGKEVSQFVKKVFPTSLLSDRMFPNVPKSAFVSACEKCNMLLRQSPIDATLSGCTCCVVLFVGNDLYTCNVGDSRSVLGSDSGSSIKVRQLTRDQTAQNPLEAQRIKAAGGRIIKNRIYCADEDLPGLIPSRSIGDFAGKRAGIICTPEVNAYKIDDDSNYVAVMSDGVWENIPSAKMSEMVARMRDNPNHTSKRIVNAAKKHIHANNKYKDDMTCVLIILYNYGRFVADKSGPTDTEFFESVAPVMDDPIDRVAAAIEHCEQLIDAGCHPDDAPDSISGLNEEERYMVENFLHKHRGAAEPRSPPPASVSPTTSPGGGISPKSQDS